MSTKNYWNIKDRPHTRLKLDIYRKYLDSWCSIFEKQKYYETVYIIDCFAGRGNYEDDGAIVDGSPMLAIKAAKMFQEKFLKEKSKNKKDFKINCIFIDENHASIESLKKLLIPYNGLVDYQVVEGDFNNAIADILKKVGNFPALFFIDPYGIKTLKRESVEKIVAKKGGRDILLNYIQEGVERIGGLAKKCLAKKSEDITIKEIKTIKNLSDFMGGLDCILKDEKEALKMYIDEILKGNNKNVDEKDRLKAIFFDMPYPQKNDTIYYLIFASRNDNAIKIVSQVYAKGKQVDFNGQQTLFDTKTTQKLNNNFGFKKDE